MNKDKKTFHVRSRRVPRESSGVSASVKSTGGASAAEIAALKNEVVRISKMWREDADHPGTIYTPYNVYTEGGVSVLGRSPDLPDAEPGSSVELLTDWGDDPSGKALGAVLGAQMHGEIADVNAAAERAETKAASAKLTADSAQIAADTAKKAAAAAQSDAADAMVAAEGAGIVADKAVADAANAQSTADSAISAARDVMVKATDAENAAKAAQITANTAGRAADKAQADATLAKTAAAAADKKATDAQASADDAQTSADNAGAVADIAKAAADSAKTAAAAAAKDATTALGAASTASSMAAGAQTKADAAEATANAAAQSVSEVRAKLELVKTAAAAADKKATDAQASADDAQTSADNAGAVADIAKAAADSAKTAAATAQADAKEAMSGVVINEAKIKSDRQKALYNRNLARGLHKGIIPINAEPGAVYENRGCVKVRLTNHVIPGTNGLKFDISQYRIPDGTSMALGNPAVDSGIASYTGGILTLSGRGWDDTLIVDIAGMYPALIGVKFLSGARNGGIGEHREYMPARNVHKPTHVELLDLFQNRTVPDHHKWWNGFDVQRRRRFVAKPDGTGCGRLRKWANVSSCSTAGVYRVRRRTTRGYVSEWVYVWSPKWGKTTRIKIIG